MGDEKWSAGCCSAPSWRSFDRGLAQCPSQLLEQCFYNALQEYDWPNLVAVRDLRDDRGGADRRRVYQLYLRQILQIRWRAG